MNIIEVNLLSVCEILMLVLDLHEIREHGHDEEESPF